MNSVRKTTVPVFYKTFHQQKLSLLFSIRNFKSHLLQKQEINHSKMINRRINLYLLIIKRARILLAKKFKIAWKKSKSLKIRKI